MPSARSVSFAASQPGAQSPAQPISELWLPGTVTRSIGCSGSSSSTRFTALPTEA